MTTPPPIRVLVVDDSVVARRFITRRLEKDPELHIVGTASSGDAALAHVRHDPPDVVILDEEMPGMRGRDVLKILRRQYPTIAVVMFSSVVGHGSEARFEALLFGADDAVAKPTTAGGPIDDDHPTWVELLTKVKAAARRPDRGGAPVVVARDVETGLGAPSSEAPPEGTGVASVPASRPRPEPAQRRAAVTNDPGVVVIASSTGGPDALSVLFSELTDDFPLPIVLVQHMPPHFTTLLAQRLDLRSGIDVREAAGGERLRAGVAYVAPGDEHIVITPGTAGPTVQLDHAAAENSCRPSADVLFRSAAAVFGDRIVACVISGMGIDGMRGAIEINDAGGTVMVQDEATSVVWGMPGAVVRAGVAHKVVPLEQIASELLLSATALASRSTASSHRTEVAS